jgi:hypothetical protein
MSLDLELQRKSRKIVLVLDKCAAKPHLDSWKNIQLKFLSPNTTSLVQLMDMGIIKYEDLISRKVSKLHP